MCKTVSGWGTGEPRLRKYRYTGAELTFDVDEGAVVTGTTVVGLPDLVVVVVAALMGVSENDDTEVGLWVVDAFVEDTGLMLGCIDGLPAAVTGNNVGLLVDGMPAAVTGNNVGLFVVIVGAGVGDIGALVGVTVGDGTKEGWTGAKVGKLVGDGLVGADDGGGTGGGGLFFLVSIHAS